MKKINIGIIGLGTVGGGVEKAILDKRDFLKDRVGLSVCLKKVFDKDRRKLASLRIPKNIIAKNINDVLSNKDIDVVVELIGGIHPAREIILKAFKNGKHVVTANKALLAESGSEIFNAASRSGCFVGFEASVGGAMPVIKILKESFSSNRISALYGIVNGTCNFVLSRMSEQNSTLKDALKEAQKIGIAEANSKLDIEGDDSCHKLCILAMLAFGRFVTPKDIYVEGIKDLDIQDILYAKSWGYDVKLLAIAKRNDDSVELRVHPTLIPLKHLLSAVKHEDNAVFIKGDMIGESMIYGKGAGRYPAASSVVSDVMDIAKDLNCGHANCHFYPIAKNIGVKKISKIGDLVTRYYIRFSAIDRPGVLAAVSSILAKNKISIATVTQKERKNGQVVPIVMLTHDARESSMNRALAAIDKLSFIKSKTVKIRIER